MALTGQQQRERAIQRVIERTFSADISDWPGVLIAAAARIIQSRNGGRPLSSPQAQDATATLFNALTNPIYGATKA